MSLMDGEGATKTRPNWLRMFSAASRAEEMIHSGGLCDGYTYLDLQLSDDGAVIDCLIRSDAPANYTMELMSELRRVQREVSLHNSRINARDGDEPIKVLTLRSARPGVFNLGGDIAAFLQGARARDRAFFSRYGRLCIDLMWGNMTFLDADVLLVAHVAGDCFGGGFESALSCDYIVAEPAARFGFPEHLFGLFPGMGAYSILDRKLKSQDFERLVERGDIIETTEAQEIGLSQIKASEDVGGLDRFVKKLVDHHHMRLASAKARKRVEPQITKDELIDVVETWAEAAASLPDKRLRMIERLVKAQTNRFGAANTR